MRPCSGFEARLFLTRLPTLVSTAPCRATEKVDVVRVHHRTRSRVSAELASDIDLSHTPRHYQFHASWR